MKYLIFFLFPAAFISTNARAQDPVKLDMLKAPVSPASNLLGFAASDIDKPTDISRFMLSLQEATGSFSKLPANYAIDVAPFLIGNKSDDNTTKGLASKDFGSIFRQTFVISAAISNPDSSNKKFDYKNTYAALGFHFSLIRGDYDDDTKEALNDIGKLQGKILTVMSKIAKNFKEKNDPEILRLDSLMEKELNDASDEELPKILKDENSELNKLKRQKSALTLRALTVSEKAIAKAGNNELESLEASVRERAASFQTNRIGFTWDMNAGVSAAFIGKKFDNSKIHNAGIWQTIGYTGKKGSSFLGLIRFLYNPDAVFAQNNTTNTLGNITTFDAGFRYAYSKPQSPFSCSAEGIYRSVLSSNTIRPSWKFVLNADYALFENQKLGFTFGRDFDGAVTKDGSLIAALTFLKGFGNRKTVK